MLSKSEIESYWKRDPRWHDTMATVQAIGRLPGGLRNDVKEAVAIARKFNEVVGRPASMEIDFKVHEDPDYLPWDMVKKANEWGFFTMGLPKLMGGKGFSVLAMNHVSEELASVCLGLANLAFVHYLGVAGLAATMNMSLFKRVMADVVAGEKNGDPCSLSLAITEPSAGTDVEDVDLVDRGTVRCQARKVEGGYIVNGSKVFISMGHVSKWNILICYEDLSRPSDTTVMLAIPVGTKGFTFGRIERKLGQKACCASELIFEDCFVPDDQVCLSSSEYSNYNINLPIREVTREFIDAVLATTRASVAAWGAGVARGAYEEARKFACETEVDGKLLINHEWAQSLLADMYANAASARLAYSEAGYINSLYGPMKDMMSKPMFFAMKHTPQIWNDLVIHPMMDKPFVTRAAREGRYKNLDRADSHRTVGWGSMAKYIGTDAGVENCHLAIELMGQAGVRHDHRVEKHLRDAKLLQIYEGTNQLNRLHVFNSFIAPKLTQVKPFDEEVP